MQALFQEAAVRPLQWSDVLNLVLHDFPMQITGGMQQKVSTIGHRFPMNARNNAEKADELLQTLTS